MLGKCDIIRAYKARPEVLRTQPTSRLLNLVRRFFAMSELYHDAQLFPSPLLEHHSPDCECVGRCCTLCGEVKCILFFFRHRDSKDGRRRYCNTCSSKHQRKYVEANPDRARRYSITYDEYMALIERQSGCCAICGNPPQDKNQYGVKRLAIDHDHATGQIRGLLCYNCNVMLGHARDSVDVLQSAIAYLEK